MQEDSVHGIQENIIQFPYLDINHSNKTDK